MVESCTYFVKGQVGNDQRYFFRRMSGLGFFRLGCGDFDVVDFISEI